MIKEIVPTLKLAGYKVSYKKIEMTTRELAEEYRFVSSPTILVNGQDIYREVEESDCKCCSAISGTSVNCRTFPYDGVEYEVPTKTMMAEAILRGCFAPATLKLEEYKMPENLKKFYRGKGRQDSVCSCGSH